MIRYDNRVLASCNSFFRVPVTFMKIDQLSERSAWMLCIMTCNTKFDDFNLVPCHDCTLTIICSPGCINFKTLKKSEKLEMNTIKLKKNKKFK